MVVGVETAIRRRRDGCYWKDGAGCSCRDEREGLVGSGEITNDLDLGSGSVCSARLTTTACVGVLKKTKDEIIEK